MATYYVSTSGNNANDGLSTSTPWETSAYALTQIVRGDILLFKKGDKFPPLIISGIAASGTTTITFGDYGTGNEPIFSGALEVPSWVNEGGNLWSYTNASFVKVEQLKIGGVQKERGTFPSSGYYFPTSFSGNTSLTDTVNLAGQDFTGGELFSRKEPWVIDRQSITGHAGSTLTVTGVGSNFNGNGYKIQNHPDCCTADGDWAFYASEDKVYLYSLTDPNTLNIEVSFYQRSLEISSSPYLIFFGLAFEMAYEDNIFRSFSPNIIFNRCLSRFSGRDGMKSFVSPRCTWTTGLMQNIANIAIHERDTGGDFISGSIFKNSKFENIGIIAGYGQSGSGQMCAIFVNNQEADVEVFECYFKKIGNIAVNSRSPTCYIHDLHTEQASFTVRDAAAYYFFGSNSTGSICEKSSASNCHANNDGLLSSNDDASMFYLDDNSNGCIGRKLYGFDLDRGLYLHNTEDSTVDDNIVVNALEGIRFRDDTLGVRIRNNSVQRNIISVDAGQKIVSMTTISAYSGSDPWLYGTLANNKYDRVDPDSYFTDIPGGAESQISRTLAGYQTYTGLDATSTEESFDRNSVQIILNDSFTTSTIPITGTWEDWDGNVYTDSIDLGSMESKTLFAVSEPPPPSTDKWRYKKLVLPQDYFGNLIYDTYQTSKAANGNFEVPFVQIRNLVNNVKDFGWDLLCVPFTNKDDTVYSMIGPNLTVTGGDNGSKFNRFGLLETELQNNRPRYNFNPDTGIYEGVYVEIEDQNKIIFSEQINGTGWINGGGVTVTPDFYDSPDGSQTADKIDISASGSQSNAGVGTINTEGTYYISCFVNFKTLSADRDFRLALVLTISVISQELIDIDLSFLNKWTYLSAELPLNSGQSFDFAQFNGFGRGVGDTYSLWGTQLSNHPGSYIKTSGVAVTRPSDVYTATGAIIGTTYTIVKYTSENKIAYYYDAGNKTTYIDGFNTGTVAEAPSSDFVISGTGSEKVQLMGLIEGVKTNQELIDLTT